MIIIRDVQQITWLTKDIVAFAWGNRDGAVLRALTSHQCLLGSIPGPGVICELSLL